MRHLAGCGAEVGVHRLVELQDKLGESVESGGEWSSGEEEAGAGETRPDSQDNKENEDCELVAGRDYPLDLRLMSRPFSSSRQFLLTVAGSASPNKAGSPPGSEKGEWETAGEKQEEEEEENGKEEREDEEVPRTYRVEDSPARAKLDSSDSEGDQLGSDCESLLSELISSAMPGHGSSGSPGPRPRSAWDTAPCPTTPKPTAHTVDTDFLFSPECLFSTRPLNVSNNDSPSPACSAPAPSVVLRKSRSEHQLAGRAPLAPQARWSLSRSPITASLVPGVVIKELKLKPRSESRLQSRTCSPIPRPHLQTKLQITEPLQPEVKPERAAELTSGEKVEEKSGGAAGGRERTGSLSSLSSVESAATERQAARMTASVISNYDLTISQIEEPSAMCASLVLASLASASQTR